jgi:hypothetical protein
MELPFAVESSSDPPVTGSSLQQSESSLVTASSQGSFMNSSGGLDGPLPPNTPQDVVLPRYDNIGAQGQQRMSGHLVTPAAAAQREQDPKDVYGEPELIDFTYVNVCETDADEVDIFLEGGDVDLQEEPERGDVLTVLLSGMQHNGNESLVVRIYWRYSRNHSVFRKPHPFFSLILRTKQKVPMIWH